MKILRRALILAPVVGLTLSGAFSGLPTASAAATCNEGQVCVYQNPNFTGSVYKVPNACQLDFSQQKFNNGDPLDDQVSSVINNTDFVLIMFKDPRAAGDNLAISGHDKYADLASVKIAGVEHHFNDVMSSIC